MKWNVNKLQFIIAIGLALYLQLLKKWNVNELQFMIAIGLA